MLEAIINTLAVIGALVVLLPLAAFAWALSLRADERDDLRDRPRWMERR